MPLAACRGGVVAGEVLESMPLSTVPSGTIESSPGRGRGAGRYRHGRCPGDPAHPKLFLFSMLLACLVTGISWLSGRRRSRSR